MRLNASPPDSLFSLSNPPSAQALLQEHKTQQEFKSLPSRYACRYSYFHHHICSHVGSMPTCRIVVVEGLKAATAHLDRRPADSSSSREESSTSTSGSRRGRRSGGSASAGDVDMRELHDSLIKLFSPFGSVTYVNEHLFAAEGNPTHPRTQSHARLWPYDSRPAVPHRCALCVLHPHTRCARGQGGGGEGPP